MKYRLAALPYLAIHLHRSLAQGTGSVSIHSYAPWVSERACGAQCVWIDTGHIGAHPDIAVYVGCPSPYLNLCLCNSDYGTSVTSFLASCVSSRCSTDSQSAAPEITTAVEVYNGYCAQAVGVTFPSFTSEAAPTGNSTSAGSAARATSGIPANTGTTSTQGSSATSQDSGYLSSITGLPPASSGGLSESDKIALGVGLGMGLPSILLAVVTYISVSRRRRSSHSTATMQ